jgi:serine/threonine protein kinase
MPEQIAWYQYPDKKGHDVWYRCHDRDCIVYIYFPDHWEGEHEVEFALKRAVEQNIDAIQVTRKCPKSAVPNNSRYSRLSDRLLLTPCQFKPHVPHFNSDFDAVDHGDLVELKELSRNVKLVSFHDQQFAYKFITPKRYQNAFETEVENYKKLAGVPGIPRLTAVVRKEGLIQGLLMSYIEGIDLWCAVYSAGTRAEDLLLDITFRIIGLAADLERREFYHEDLKCSNIMRRHDGELFFIDLGGGLTEGMYRMERESVIFDHGPDATDALFTLGRTLWELWAAESPWKGAPLHRVSNETVRRIIADCEQGNVESILHLSEKYCGRTATHDPS